MLGKCRMRAHAKRVNRVQEGVVRAWSIDRASDAALVLMHRAHRAVDAAEETWRAGKLRVTESQSGHDQGGTRGFGLRVCTRIKMLPQWGHRGASERGLTTGVLGVVVWVTVAASPTRALVSR